MDEQIIFTTNATGSISNVHSYEQANLRQCAVASANSAVRVGSKYLFVAQAKKALIHVYSAAYNVQRESIEQRLPLPEVVNCLEVVESNANVYAAGEHGSQMHNLPQLDLPYLLLASTESGKLYIWELNSGLLLNVKPAAHYQAITKIKSIMNGKYIVTSGKDARVIIWQTSDLVSQEEPKPVAILHDHTLPVTDFEVSSAHGDNLFTSGVKLYTVSKDATLRCYDLSSLVNQGNNKRAGATATPQLLSTFTLPYPVNCVSVDPAERSVYLGTQTGCFSLQLFYKLNGNRMSNLLQLSDSNMGNIYSLVEESKALGSDDGKINRDALYAKGQLLCQKLIDDNTVCLRVSMDGSIILIGDNHGRVHVTEIFSKQVLKTLQPLSTSQTMHGEVTNILLSTYTTTDNEKLNLSAQGNKNGTQLKGLEKLPILQRVVFDKSDNTQKHDVWFQLGEDYESSQNPCTPLADLEGYLANVQSQESAFVELSGVSSEVTSVQDTSAGASADPTQDEVAALKQNVASLTSAYKELREIHEKLYEEHQKLKN